MPIDVTNREYRDMKIEILAVPDNEPEAETEERKIVAGYATVFDSPYTLYGDDNIRIEEVVDKDAFDGADMADVIMQYDHEGRVFARTRNNTLTVTPDGKGLFITADLGGTELGRQLYEEIRGGYTDKMSFGFTVSADEWSKEIVDGVTVNRRVLKRIGKLYDVSAVSIPANDATSISVRNMADGVIDQIRAERLEAERIETERRRAEVRARAMLGGLNE